MDGLDIPGPAPHAPLIVGSALYEELFRATRALMALLMRAVTDAGADAQARIDALQADPADYPLLTDDPDEYRYWGAVARPDIVLEGGRPRVLEINIGGGVGGTVETEGMQRAWARAYVAAGIEPPSAYSALDARAALYERACAQRGAPRAVVLVATLRDFADATPRYFELELSHLRALGFDAEWFEPEDLAAGLGLPGRPRAEVGLRNFTISEWRAHGIDLAPVAAAQDAGCLLLAPQAASLLDDKRTLAWISEGRGCRTEQERRLVQRYVPWTRVTVPGPTTWRAATLDLEEIALAHRDELVLKGAVSMQGERVTIGRATAPAAWAAEVREALARRDCILQEYVEPDRMALGGGGAPADDVAPVLSPFLIGGRPGGCMVRYLPEGRYGVVNVDNFGARMNVAMTHAPLWHAQRPPATAPVLYGL